MPSPIPLASLGPSLYSDSRSVASSSESESISDAAERRIACTMSGEGERALERLRALREKKGDMERPEKRVDSRPRSSSSVVTGLKGPLSGALIGVGGMVLRMGGGAEGGGTAVALSERSLSLSLRPKRPNRGRSDEVLEEEGIEDDDESVLPNRFATMAEAASSCPGGESRRRGKAGGGPSGQGRRTGEGGCAGGGRM